MDTLKAVDGVEVLILIDNTTDNLSSVPSFVETEFAALERRRHRLWVSGGQMPVLRCLRPLLSDHGSSRRRRKNAALRHRA
jgi:hypothetical protein